MVHLDPPNDQLIRKNPNEVDVPLGFSAKKYKIQAFRHHAQILLHHLSRVPTVRKRFGAVFRGGIASVFVVSELFGVFQAFGVHGSIWQSQRVCEK